MTTDVLEANESIEGLWPYLQIPRNLAYRFVDEQVFCWLLGPRISSRFGIMEGLGLDIFRAIEKGQSLTALVNSVTERYTVAPATVLADVSEFVLASLEAGMFSVGGARVPRLKSGDARWREEQSISADDVLDLMYDRASAGAHPLKVFLELTYQCNHRCTHCYLGLGTEVSAHGEPLPTSRFMELLDEMAAEGVLELVLTGGEPTMHPDFPAILRRAADLRFAVTVLTNGTLLDDELIELLASVPVQVRIPVYGLEPYHNRFVRNIHSFQNIMKGIERLAELGVDVLPASLLMKDNGKDLIELKRWCDDLGLPFLLTPLLYPTVFQVGAPTSLRASDQTLRALMPQLGIQLRRHRCTMGLSRFRITPDGSLDACEMLPISFGNLRKTAFKEVLASPARQEWIERFPLILKQRAEGCKSCAVQPYCIDCTGLAYLETMSYTEHSKESCRLAHISAYAEACEARIKVLA